MKSDLTTFLQSSEWGDVLEVYGRVGVAQACLLLQDALGVDVLVMLHLGHVSKKSNTALPENLIGAADAVVRDWRNQVVHPLRSARRAIAKENSATHVLRASIQKVELVAEQHALAELAAMPAWKEEHQDGARLSVYLVAAFYAELNGCKEKLQAPEIQRAIHLLEQELFEKK